MSLREVSTAKDERESAQGPLWEAIGFGVDLIQHLKNEDEQLEEQAIQVGVERLKDAFVRYKAAIEKSKFN